MPDACVEGQELYLHFFHEQVRNAGLGDLEDDFGLSHYHAHGVHHNEEHQRSPRQRNRTLSMNLENFSVGF